MNSTRIIQGGIGGKSMRKELSFVRGRDSNRAIRIFQRRKRGRSKVIGEIFGQMPKRSGRGRIGKILTFFLWMKEFLASRRTDFAQFRAEIYIE